MQVEEVKVGFLVMKINEVAKLYGVLKSVCWIWIKGVVIR